MSGFVKLYGTILDSTIWLESLPTKVVWITMLAMADSDGFVAGAVPTLAKRAGVNRVQCESALATLSAPDLDSKTTDHEGRRIEKVDGGWVILNHRKYRDLRTDTQIATAERVRKHRERQREGVTVTDVTPRNVPTRTEAEVDTEAKAEVVPSTHPPAVKLFLAELPEGQNARHWSAIINGWQQGLGFEGGKAATAEDVATGLTEYLAGAKRDFAVIHVRSFVERAYRNRLKAAARPNDRSSEQATRIWQLIKSQGIHHRTTDREISAEVATLVADGRVKDGVEFTVILKKLDFGVLRKAQQESFAVKHIAERLNGTQLRVA